VDLFEAKSDKSSVSRKEDLCVLCANSIFFLITKLSEREVKERNCFPQAK